jgi:deoxyribodipyrimidine photolyase-related protein
MILYADGGLFASKPYAASGNYINKMSDYCGKCVYDVKKRHGEGACPFNYLYWDFVARNRNRMARNPRTSRSVATLERMAPEKVEAARADSRRFLDGLTASGDY